MPHETRNVGASVRARLLTRARAEKTDYQILLTRYALERLLYRLSISAHRDRFVLKGALLFVTWLDDPFRPTRDLDLLGYGARDVEAITETFRSICSTQIGPKFSGSLYGRRMRGSHMEEWVDKAYAEAVKLSSVTFGRANRQTSLEDVECSREAVAARTKSSSLTTNTLRAAAGFIYALDCCR
jgi:nucleotidyltransferase AbiEii toxin of type IV toxin-antitoxin system